MLNNVFISILKSGNNRKFMIKIFSKIVNKFLSLNNPVSRYIVRLKRYYRIRKFQKRKRKIIEVGGGKYPLDKENLNIDISAYHAVDLVTDLLESLPFKNGEIDKIISVALLEHFNILDIRNILREFHRVLKKDGELELSVPSLNKIFAYYKVHGCDDVLLRYLHGAQKDKYDIHLCVMDVSRLAQELKNVGFRRVEEVEYNYPLHEKKFMMKIVGYRQK